MASSRALEMLCIVLLGLGQMCIMTGYDTQSFVAESVLHSVNGREPTRIDALAGYYGQATCYAGYMIACLFAPSILSFLSPKWTLFLGSVCYTIYQIGFLYLNNYYYYTSCAVMGVGFALYYAGHGSYLTSHSTRKTIEQNSAIAWSIACLCMIVGGGILAAIFSLNRSVLVDSSEHMNATTTHPSHAYRQFSDAEIRMMYGAFAAVTFCANLIFAFAPSRDIENCIEGKHNRVRRTFREEMSLIRDIFTDSRMITLSPLFVHLGLYTSFWVSIYPTTLVFAKQLSGHIYLLAFYSVAVGIGEVLMGVIISGMSKRVKNFGLEPTMFMAFGITSVLLVAVLASVPQWATVRPTDEPAWFIQPSALLSTVIAFLFGMADSAVNNVRNVICALALPDKRAQAFAISKFYQALAGALLMFTSPYLSVAHYTALLFCTLSLSTLCFVRIAAKTKRVESAQEDKGPVVLRDDSSIEKF